MKYGTEIEYDIVEMPIYDKQFSITSIQTFYFMLILDYLRMKKVNWQAANNNLGESILYNQIIVSIFPAVMVNA